MRVIRNGKRERKFRIPSAMATRSVYDVGRQPGSVLKVSPVEVGYQPQERTRSGGSQDLQCYLGNSKAVCGRNAMVLVLQRLAEWCVRPQPQRGELAQDL